MHTAPPQVPKKQLAFSQPGLALAIAKQSIEAKGSKTHVTDNAPRDAKYSAGTDCPPKTVVGANAKAEVGGAVRQLLTTGLWSSSAAADDKGGRLVAVLQLRDRAWQPGWRKERPGDKQLAKFSGFTTMDASWMNTLKQVTLPLPLPLPLPLLLPLPCPYPYPYPSHALAPRRAAMHVYPSPRRLVRSRLWGRPYWGRPRGDLSPIPFDVQAISLRVRLECWKSISTTTSW